MIDNELGLMEDVNELDSVLGLDDNSSEGSTDNFVDTFSDEVHISLPIRDINVIINISNTLKSCGENSFEGKLVAFKVVDGNVKFMLSDNKRSITRYVKALNDTNHIEGFICLNVLSLSRIVRLCDDVFTLIERVNDNGEKEYTVAVHGGEVHVDNYKADESRFNHEYNDILESSVNRENMIGYIKRLYNYSQAAGGRSRYLSFCNNTITVESFNSMAKLRCDDSFGSGFRLHLADCKLLVMLLNSDNTDIVGFNNSGDLYRGSNFVFKTEAFKLEDDSVQQSVYGRMVVDNKCDVSLEHLRKIVELACGLPETTGDINVSFDGCANVEIVSRRGNSSIKLDTVSLEGIFDIGKISLSANAFKQIISTLSGYDVATMRLSPDGVALDNEVISMFVLKKAF